MSEIKIETLSPIHIGNGTFLQKGNDYIVEEDYIDVLSLDKLGIIIGYIHRSAHLIIIFHYSSTS